MAEAARAARGRRRGGRDHRHRRTRRAARRRSRSGLVFIALDGAAGTRVRRCFFPGERAADPGAGHAGRARDDPPRAARAGRRCERASAAAATIRAFVALELPDAVQLTAWPSTIDAPQASRCPASAGSIPDQTHLTLRFLGWTTRERLTIAGAAARSAPPRPRLPHRRDGLAASGCSRPPAARRACCGWASTLPPDGHGAAGGLRGRRRGSGFPPERRAFKPHLTLGRWRDPAPRPRALPRRRPRPRAPRPARPLPQRARRRIPARAARCRVLPAGRRFRSG